MIISNFKFLGLTLYKRVRISEEIIVFDFESIHCSDIGIYLVREYPRLKFNHVSVYQKKEWDKLALETFCLAILSLINLKIIEIVEYTDSKFYFLNLIKFNSKSYYLNVINDKIENDLFSNSIIDSIKEVNRKYKLKTDLFKIIHYTLDKFLGNNEEYNRPAKKFLIKNLETYAITYDWIKIKQEKKLLGLYKDYQLELNEIYIPRIKMEHKSLKGLNENLLKTHTKYLNFFNELKKVLETDFKRREPKSDMD